MATKQLVFFEAPRSASILRREPMSRTAAAGLLRRHRERGHRVYRKSFHGSRMYELDNGYTYDGWIYIALRRDEATKTT